MGKFIFLGVTAFLAMRYITRSTPKDSPKLPSAAPEPIEAGKPAQLPPKS